MAWPALAFARNPTGQFHPQMVAFAALVGLGLALGQVLALAVARALPVGSLVLWVPGTVVGVIALVMPLWWMDAIVLVLAPWFALAVVGPGLVIVGAWQGVLVRPFTSGKRWFQGTTIGGAEGVFGGILVAIAVAVPPGPVA